MNSNPVKKLVLKKETLRNLIVKSDARFGASTVTQKHNPLTTCD
jgi:hypothetical protein